jgi:hypothetical protein
VLNKLKESFNWYKWYYADGWEQIDRKKRPGRIFTGIYGVKLDKKGRVIGIDMPHNNMSGYLPESIKSLSKLKQLSLPDNDIMGFVDDEPFPASLVRIDLSGNSLKRFDNSMLNLKYIQELNLSNNRLKNFEPQFQDSIPLRTIDISYNLLDTVSITNLFPRLEYVNLSHNRLRYVNVNFSKCYDLNIFDLSHNLLKFESLTPLLYHLPKKLGRLITSDQEITYYLEYDQGMNAVYVSDVMDKTNLITWYKGPEKLELTKPFIELRSGYYRDYTAIIRNPFFPDTSIKAVWKN